MKTKLITVKKRGGGTRKQLAQVLASGKLKFIKMKNKARSRPKTRVSKPNKQRKSNKQVQRSKGSRMRRRPSKDNIKNFFKGFLGGTGAAELSEEGVLLVTDNAVATTVVSLAAAAPAGWWTGQKSTSGLIGGLAGAGLDIALKLLIGRSQSTSRFARL